MNIYFEIHVDDTTRAVAFYRAVFNWKFTEVPGLPIAYWSIEADGSWGGLLKRPANTPSPEQGANAFVCSLEVADFDQTAELIMKNGGMVAMPKFAVPNKCWQGYFLDTEGNVFGLFQVDPNAK